MIVHVVTATVAGLLLLAATRGRPVVVSEDGTLLFRYSPLFRGIAIFFGMVVPLAIIVVSFFAPIRDARDFRGVAILFAGFFCIGMPLWREASRFALVVSDEGLDCHSPWRSRKFIAWDDVESLSFGLQSHWFTIKSRDKRTFRVHAYVSGISEFLEQCEKHLTPYALSRAKFGYIQVGRPYPGP